MLHLAFNLAPLLHTEAKVEDCETDLYKSCTNRPYEEDRKNPAGDDCNCKNEGDLGGNRPIGPPAGEKPDDNFSFSSGNTTQYSYDSKCLVYMNGYFKEADALFGGNYFEGSNSAEQLLEASPVLIFPTAGLFGMENDSTLKAILQEYVRLGGSIIVFTNQYGEQIDKIVPVPEGQSLHSYGFREDQSCFNGSLYFKNMHPVLSSQINERTSAGVDGYFSIYPATSKVLLRKITNQEPTLLYYPYGQGTVILTSMYTDWGLAHSQASADELKLVRDLVTFAKNPNLPIPMYDLSAAANPEINLQVKVRLRAYSPDRKRLFFESETGLSLEPSQEAQVPLSFPLPAVTASEYGIGHVDYELYDAEGNIVQLATEADSGRLVA
jgi:hypothetical protein